MERKDETTGDGAAAGAEGHRWEVTGGLHCLFSDAALDAAARSASSSSTPSSPAAGGTKIAAFDMDGTLIEPKSGKKFAAGRSDWRWRWPDRVPARLRELHGAGHLVVIVSNQGGVEKGHTDVDHVRGKIEDMRDELGFPLLAFLATRSDHARKPGTAAWAAVAGALERAGAPPPDLGASFYVGDAAGRPKGWAPGAPRDFSCSDRKFAANVGVEFHTPEEFFCGDKRCESFSWGGDAPADLLRRAEASVRGGMRAAADARGYRGRLPLVRPGERELVVLCGPPACGKSTISERVFVQAGYVRVNQDTLGTRPRCVKAAREALAAGRSVVIDNTCRDAKTRADYVALARDAGVEARAVVFEVDKELIMHLNKFRVRHTAGERAAIPSVAIHTFFKRFERPTVKGEGFVDVGTIGFVGAFADEDDRALFMQWS